MIAPENAASIRVAEKCGFARWAETLYKDDPAILFKRPARCHGKSSVHG